MKYNTMAYVTENVVVLFQNIMSKQVYMMQNLIVITSSKIVKQ